jgi:hypothetical protein
MAIVSATWVFGLTRQFMTQLVCCLSMFVGRGFGIGTTGRAVRSVVLLPEVDSFSIRRPGSACHALTG